MTGLSAAKISSLQDREDVTRLQSLPGNLIAILDERAPDLWRKCDVMRSKKGAEWPKDIVLPTWAIEQPNPVKLKPGDPDHWQIKSLNNIGYDHVYANLLATGYTPEDRVLLMVKNKLAAFYAWRATKLEFRFDADFSLELAKTPLSGEIPVGLLRHLPASCIYVSVPGDVLPGYVGFFACLDQPSRKAEPVLTLWAASEHRWPAHMVDIPLSPGHLVEQVALIKEQASQKNVEEFLRGAGCDDADEKAEVFAGNKKKWAEERSSAIGKALSFLLYLCSEEPDLPADYKKPERREKIVGTQRRIIPPTAVTAWPVGTRIGAVFREERETGTADEYAEGGGQAHIVRPHVRRAHWHTYWTGPKGAQSPKIKWLSPIIVAMRSAGESLPTVIRPVEPPPSN
jgi:hypothetical protein